MTYLQGSLIAGKFDNEQNLFYVQQVKQFPIESNLNEKITNSLYNYLQINQQDEDGLVLTLYDQMPIMITKNEIEQLMKDLDQVKSLFH
jgi:hypothetical protein